MKTCSKCKVEQPTTAFYKKVTRYSVYLRNVCKACERVIARLRGRKKHGWAAKVTDGETVTETKQSLRQVVHQPTLPRTKPTPDQQEWQRWGFAVIPAGVA